MAMLGTLTSAYRDQRRVRAAATPRPRRTPLLAHAGRTLARLLPSWSGVRTAAFSVSGLGCLTAAAWTLHLAAGLAAAGMSLLILEWLTGGDR